MLKFSILSIHSSSVPPTSSLSTSSASSINTNNQPQQQQITFSGKFYQMLNKASTVFQIFALSQMGCASESGRNFKRNILKKTTRGNHWGDLRAKLEVDIQEILALVIEMNRVAANEELLKEMREKEEQTEDDDVFIEAKAKTLALLKETRYRSTSSSSSAIQPTATTNINTSIESSSKSDELKSLNIELITLVRKRFAVTLQKLIQHGLRSVNETKHLVPFMGCFSTLPINIGTNASQDYEDYKEMHAWELILEYYKLRNGDFYTETPAQKLSQSFNLDIVGEGFHSNKQVD
jgi:RUN domain-containing protein 1